MRNTFGTRPPKKLIGQTPPESEGQYRTLFDDAAEPILIHDAQARLLAVNPPACERLGYTSAELLALTIDQVDSQEEGGHSPERLLELMEKGRLTFETVQRHKNGSLIPTEVSARRIIWEGRPAVMSICRDLTERKRVEETLLRTEGNFHRSLDDSPLGVRIVTAAGVTIYANRELLNFYGYDSLEELDRVPTQERFAPLSDSESGLEGAAGKPDPLAPKEYEISIVRKNGEIRHLQVYRKELIWNGEKQYQSLYRDITEEIQALYRDIAEEKKRGEVLRQFEATIQGQKSLLEQQSLSVDELIGRLTRSREDLAASYEALKANRDDLVRSEKLAFSGRMAAGIAHEIRNPLANIVLSLDQLNKDDKIKPEGRRYAEIIERNSKRIDDLVTELLNCARPIKLNLRPLDIHQILRDILNLLKVRLKAQKIKVIKTLTPRAPVLPADKEYLGRVFLNILSNAIEAMPHGGVLSLDTKIEKGRLRIKIQDSGIGIPEKNLIQIFDPFFSTKKKGTGLGLFACQNIVTSHGGLIEVESAWRKGAAFVVSLPLQRAKP